MVDVGGASATALLVLFRAEETAPVTMRSPQRESSPSSAGAIPEGEPVPLDVHGR